MKSCLWNPLNSGNGLLIGLLVAGVTWYARSQVPAYHGRITGIRNSNRIWNGTWFDAGVKILRDQDSILVSGGEIKDSRKLCECLHGMLRLTSDLPDVRTGSLLFVDMSQFIYETHDHEWLSRAPPTV